MKTKQKNGISLIVLVITIIVMIILAAAIILSLSNSGIISKANRAKADSDTANLKEYVNTLRAEWELMTAKEREKSESTTFEEYANKKLGTNGYKVMLSENGILMNEAATAAVKSGIKVGDVVTGYTVAANTYETSGEENTAPDRTETDPTKQTVTTNTDITWKYLGTNANGELEIMADLSTANAVATNTKVKLSGKGGYLKGPDMLNTICEKLYSVSGIGTARSMNIDDVNNILGYTGPKGAYYDNKGNEVKTPTALRIGDIDKKLGTSLGNTTTTPDGKALSTYYADCYFIDKTSDKKEMKNPGNVDLVYNAKNTYWLASSCVSAHFFERSNYALFDVRYVDSTDVNTDRLYDSREYSNSLSYTLRPVVKLDTSVKVIKDVNVANSWNISK